MKNFRCYNETKKDLKGSIKLLNKKLQRAIKQEGLKNISFNVILVDNEYIKFLNKNYRNIDRVTDVISFALEDEKKEKFWEMRLLGDIYISVERCEIQAKEVGNTFDEELSFLAIHGLLHLLGYDHMNKEDEKIMFEKQDILLGRK